eukprot:429457_1
MSLLEVQSLLKVDNKGWNIALFDESIKISSCLCAHFGSVCVDAVELGCDHDENDDIFLHCKSCLMDLIKDNGNKCMISGHNNPPLSVVRAARRQISKSMVVCPYSKQFKIRNSMQKNDNAQVVDTLGDEKEGSQQYIAAQQQSINDDEKLNSKCTWRGTLNELINKHIAECAKTNDPTFILRTQIRQLQEENLELKQQMIALKNVARDESNNRMNELIETIKKNEAKINKLNHEVNDQQKEIHILQKDVQHKDTTIKKLQNEILKNEDVINALNTSIQVKQHKIDKQQKEVEKLNNTISEQSVMTKDLINANQEKNKLIESLKFKIASIESQNDMKQNDVNKKQVLHSIETYKPKFCIVDLENSVFTTGKGGNTDTFAILQIPWTKGIHKLKLKCLESAYNSIGFGMVSNKRPTKLSQGWMFDAKESGLSYQLYNSSTRTAIYGYRNGERSYAENIQTTSGYIPNDTMEMKVDFTKLELSFFVNSRKVGKTVTIERNTYFPAIAYCVCNKYFKERGAIKIQFLSCQ